MAQQPPRGGDDESDDPGNSLDDDVDDNALDVDESALVNDAINNNLGQQQGREPAISSDWKGDPGERARRIFAWWQTIRSTESNKLKSFLKVIRIIVTNQASSAAIERVFSQLLYMVRTCGANSLEDATNIRLMRRVNDGLDADFGDSFT